MANRSISPSLALLIGLAALIGIIMLGRMDVQCAASGQTGQAPVRERPFSGIDPFCTSLEVTILPDITWMLWRLMCSFFVGGFVPFGTVPVL